MCRENAPAAVRMPDRGYRIVKFNQFSKQLRAPIVLYCDIESANVKIDDETSELNTGNSNTKKSTRHDITGFHIKPVSHIESLQDICKDISYTGKGAMNKFFQELKIMNTTIEDMYETHGKKPLIPLTPAQQTQYNKATKCHVCDGGFYYKYNASRFQADWNMRTQALEEEYKVKEKQALENNIDPDSEMESMSMQEEMFWRGPKVIGKLIN